MSIKYRNYKSILESAGLTVVDDGQKADETKTIKYKCSEDHISSLAYTSFGNKKCHVESGKIASFCSSCNQLNNARTVVANAGHTLLEYKNDKDVTYECGNCGSHNHSNLPALRKNITKRCVHCQNDDRKVDVASVQTWVKNLGLEFIHYTNNKHVVVRCKCGDEYETVLHRLVRGQTCSRCAPEKRAKTNLEKYGTTNYLASDEGKERIIQTHLEKRGVTHHMKVPEIVEKTKETNREKYGYDYAFNAPEVYEKIRQKCREKYGCDYPLQNPKMLYKATEYQRKPYKFPSGKIVHIMGYEPKAIDYLLRFYSEHDLCVENVPLITYDKNHIYHPDVYIKSENCIVEVKCPWYLTTDYDKNMIKFKAVCDQGYKMRLLVFILNGDEPFHDEYIIY